MAIVDKNPMLRNLLIQASNPKKALVMLKKLWKRFADDTGLISQQENMQWIKRHSSPWDSLANDIDPEIWKETEEVSRKIARDAQEILKKIKYKLGGGGAYPFLYFITRVMRPSIIVETGVAAGFSSCAFLMALSKNEEGVLYSSDFPYFRYPNPEEFIGIVVEESLKKNWHLYLESDESNIPKILQKIDHIDIFHYDSDKSYSGRRFAMHLIQNTMSARGIIVMDDIQNNSYFHDYVTSHSVATWSIFEFEGKYVGMIGKLKP
jgi:predicted O-methyltransferase YrrM